MRYKFKTYEKILIMEKFKNEHSSQLGPFGEERHSDHKNELYSNQDKSAFDIEEYRP